MNSCKLFLADMVLTEENLPVNKNQQTEKLEQWGQ